MMLKSKRLKPNMVDRHIAYIQQEQQKNLARLALYPALVKAAVDALALLDKQRAEYKSAVSILPRPAVTEGPIAHALRAVLAQAEAIEKEAQSG